MIIRVRITKIVLVAIAFFGSVVVPHVNFDDNDSGQIDIRKSKQFVNKTHGTLKKCMEQISKKKAKERQDAKTKWQNFGQFKVTYYWIGEDEWGDTIARPCDGQHKAIEGHTIAVDPNVIPYGTVVLLDGNEYVAEDCGGAVKGNVIDVYTTQPEGKSTHYSNLYIRKGD